MHTFRRPEEVAGTFVIDGKQYRLERGDYPIHFRRETNGEIYPYSNKNIKLEPIFSQKKSGLTFTMPDTLKAPINILGTK